MRKTKSKNPFNQPSKFNLGKYRKKDNPALQPSKFNLGGEKGNNVDDKKKKRMRY